MTELSVDNDIHKRTKSERSHGSGNDRPRKQSFTCFEIGKDGRQIPLDLKDDEDRPCMADVDRAIEDQEHPEKARSQRAKSFISFEPVMVQESPADVRDRIKAGLPPPNPFRHYGRGFDGR